MKTIGVDIGGTKTAIGVVDSNFLKTNLFRKANLLVLNCNMKNK